VNRSDLQRLADLRFSEAAALFAVRAFEGSFYLAGYAVECALKACIAKRTREFDFPDKRDVERSYTHDMTRLLDVARLEGDLASTSVVDDDLKRDWSIVRNWSESSRYALDVGEEAAQNMLIAVHGVLSWLKTRW
jgi:hypothetical protein